MPVGEAPTVVLLFWEGNLSFEFLVGAEITRHGCCSSVLLGYVGLAHGGGAARSRRAALRPVLDTGIDRLLQESSAGASSGKARPRSEMSAEEAANHGRFFVGSERSADPQPRPYCFIFL